MSQAAISADKEAEIEREAANASNETDPNTGAPIVAKPVENRSNNGGGGGASKSFGISKTRFGMVDGL